jgi:hypothetical protein
LELAHPLRLLGEIATHFSDLALDNVGSHSLGMVRGATVEGGFRSPSGASNDRGGWSYVIRYDTDRGPVDGAASPSRENLQAVADGLTAFLADASSPSFEATMTVGLWRIALWPLFMLGLRCLINIPFATAKELRRRASREGR